MGAGEAASASGSSHANASEPRSDAQTAVDTPAEQEVDSGATPSPSAEDTAGPALSVEPAEKHPLSEPVPQAGTPDATPRAQDRHDATAGETAAAAEADPATARSAPGSTSAPSKADAPAAAEGPPTPPREELHPLLDAIFHHLHIFFRWLSHDGRSPAGFNDLNMSDPYSGLAGGSQLKDQDENAPNSALVMSYEKCMLGANAVTMVREDTGKIAPEVVRGRLQEQNSGSAHAV